MSLLAPAERQGLLLVIGAGVAATALKSLWAWSSSGTSDTVLFFLFKVVPLVLASVLGIWWLMQGRRQAAKFGVAAAALVLLGSAWPLVERPGAYAHKVLGYGSYWAPGGFTYWLHQTGAAAFHTVDFKALSRAQTWVATGLKLATIASVMLLAWRRRGVKDAEVPTTIAAAFATVFVFAPGAGPQYMAWFAPFLVFSAPQWYAAITACSSAFTVAFYHPAAKSKIPWDLAFPKGGEIAVWGPWMNVPWVAFLLLVSIKAKVWHRIAESRPAPESGDIEMENAGERARDPSPSGGIPAVV
jgi:hypothetical protein